MHVKAIRFAYYFSMNCDPDFSCCMDDINETEEILFPSQQRQKLLSAQMYDQSIAAGHVVPVDDIFVQLDCHANTSSELVLQAKNSHTIQEMDAAIVNIRDWQRRRESENEQVLNELHLDMDDTQEKPETLEFSPFFFGADPSVFLVDQYRAHITTEQSEDNMRRLDELVSILASPNSVDISGIEHSNGYCLANVESSCRRLSEVSFYVLIVLAYSLKVFPFGDFSDGDRS